LDVRGVEIKIGGPPTPPKRRPPKKEKEFIRSFFLLFRGTLQNFKGGVFFIG